MNEIRVRVPQAYDIENAVLLYYERHSLSSADIKSLFCHASATTIYKLKLMARKQAEADHSMSYNSTTVNTASAYKAWGLDIDDLEKRLAKIRKIKKGNPS